MMMGIATALAMTFLFQNATAQTVNLGAANGFAVLAGTPKIENTGATKITGNVGLSPATGAGIIGFPPGQVIGTIYSVDAFGPAGSINNPGLLTAAKNDLITAYNDAAGRTGTITASNLGGLTLVAGIYTNPAFQITGALTLDGQGNPNSVWIFQTKAANGTTLTTASASSVVLINGADACRVFWQVDSATLGTGSIFNGTILALTSITATTGASVNGRLLARNGAVTLDTNTIALEICKVLVNGPGATTKKTDNAAAVAALKEAIILAAQTADRISVVGLTTIYTLGVAQLDTEVFSVQQRLSDIRTSSVPDTQSPSPSPSHSEKNPWGSKNPWGGKSGKGGESIQPSQVQLSDEDRWGFFITGTGDFSTLGDTNNATGFRGTSIGTTLGVDCRLSDHFVVGASIGYSHTDSDIIANGKLKVDGGKAAIYA
ncbi:MAG: ice-binding family protein, partial [Verrucomicrobia bacterium]|nr:ice-binding family protein [Verrucomicrobiota bacterium]